MLLELMNREFVWKISLTIQPLKDGKASLFSGHLSNHLRPGVYSAINDQYVRLPILAVTDEWVNFFKRNKCEVENKYNTSGRIKVFGNLEEFKKVLIKDYKFKETDNHKIARPFNDVYTMDEFLEEFLKIRIPGLDSNYKRITNAKDFFEKYNTQL